jgi:hypothetical protein
MNHLIPLFGGNACIPVPGQFIPKPYPAFNTSTILFVPKAAAGCRPGWTYPSIAGYSIY